ncbi:major facilitator superfamily domain-containing protein [Gymnopilus junonius]|uniref:Major facilitator superfamily domain-containing protein n=1 Tax=Gymnopilus junonius TaxID=109634 RepID=A0A9P5TJB2_GYMJU|nr:major facilitator superfamily domain-containing protein [Gymnopilus junonius]
MSQVHDAEIVCGGIETPAEERSPRYSIEKGDRNSTIIASSDSQSALSNMSTSKASTSERGVLNSCIIVMTVTSLMIINTANSTSISIALPTIQRELHLQPAQIQWIVSAYPLSSGCLFLVFGRLADVYGRKKLFTIGTLILAIFTLACAFPNKVLTLDILRGLQGIGAAATIPASLGILATAFPPSRARSLAFATFAAGAPIGAVIGTALGGVLTEFTEKTWRSSFYLFSGLTFLCCLGGLVSIDRDLPSEEKDRRIDWAGAFLVTAGLVLVVFVLSQGEIAPDKWATPYIIVLLILGVCLIGVFLYWQHLLETIQNDPEAIRSRLFPPPLMKLTIWTRANGRFAAMMGIAFTNWCAFLAWTYWVQLYYQNYMGYSAMQTVVRLMPMFISGMLCNLFVGFMAAHVPIIFLVGVGAFATATACLLFAVIIPKTTYWAFAFNASYISVFGADFVFSSGTLFIAKFALPHEQSVAGALFNTMTQLGTAVGVTVTTVVFNRVSERIPSNEDNIRAYHAAQWTAFTFGIIATLLGLIFFRGVGVVGTKTPPKAQGPSDSISAHEKGVSNSELPEKAVDEIMTTPAVTRTPTIGRQLPPWTTGSSEHFPSQTS